MPPSIPAPKLKIKLETLHQDAFAPFGTVIQNPAHNSSHQSRPSPNVIEANQGSALKYIDVSHLTNHYGSASSKKAAKSVVNMFVCKPRKLRLRKADSGIITDQVIGTEVEHVFDVSILERHPYTPQTFIPMGIAKDDVTTKYLVIVAPTLPSKRVQPSNRALRRMQSIFYPWATASPVSDVKADADFAAPKPKGSGLPDLQNLRAFLADGSQAVTYGPGTWHAPMVVLGDKPIDFVVVQYSNGVSDEDCQEVLLQSTNEDGLSVVVEIVPESQQPLRSKL
jgi:ureidoglycolate lyase